MWKLLSAVIFFSLGFLAASILAVATPPAWGWSFPSNAKTVSKLANVNPYLAAPSSSSVYTVLSVSCQVNDATGGSSAKISCGNTQIAAIACGDGSATGAADATSVDVQYVCTGFSLKTAGIAGNVANFNTVYTEGTPVPAAAGSTSVDVALAVDWEGWYWFLTFILFIGVFFPVVFYFRHR